MKFYIYSIYIDYFDNLIYHKENADNWYSAYGIFIARTSQNNCSSCKVTYFDTEGNEKVALNYKTPKFKRRSIYMKYYECDME